MRRTLCLLTFILLITTLAATAQDATPTPQPPTPHPVTPGMLFSTPSSVATVVPPANDARIGVCAAPNLPNFVPYTVRFGDISLADLLTGSTAITPTQLAALNCLDDAAFLPGGATIWLPADAFVVSGTAAEITPEPGGAAPQISSFTASAETVPNDQGVTLSWEAQGDAAYLYMCSTLTDSACVRPRSAQPQPLSGAVTIRNFHRAGPFYFQLEVVGSDANSEPVTQRVLVDGTCAQVALSGTTNPCPEDPARTVTAVWQPFQNGVMMWFSDTSLIYVMTNDDGRVRVFQDAYAEGMADPNAVAPEGLFTPVRGFGLIWQALGGAEGSGLGWAMAQEIAFDSARQPAGRTSYTTYIQGPGATIYAITEIPGLDQGFWAQVAG